MSRRKTPIKPVKTSRPKKSDGFTKKLQALFHWLLRVILAFFVVSILWVVLYKWVDPPLTYLMLKRKISALWEGKPASIHYEFVPYEDISAFLPLAIVASEDQKFPTHWGFDLVSMARAVEKNAHSKKIRGGSTISQQVAKNVFLWDGRSYLRKGLEAYFTVLIEVCWGKKRILEVYLNVAEMGPLTFGAEAACLKFFKKPAKKLSRIQAATLAAVLPNPLRFSAANPSGFVVKRRNWILMQMNHLGVESVGFKGKRD